MWYNMDKPWRHYTEWSKPVTKRQILCHPTHTRCREWLSSEKQSHTHRVVSTWGQGKRGVGSQCLWGQSFSMGWWKSSGDGWWWWLHKKGMYLLPLYTQKWLNDKFYVYFTTMKKLVPSLWHPWRVLQNQIKYCLEKTFLFLECIGCPSGVRRWGGLGWILTESSFIVINYKT